MKKTHYQVLGLKRDADQSEIKKAHREAVKRYHPDVFPEGGEKFRASQEAFETLSDSAKRATYDRNLERAARHPAPSRGYGRSSSPFFEGFDRLFGGLDDFWDFPFASALFAETRGAGALGGLGAEIILTPKEAREGCEVPLTVPFWTTCRHCRGSGTRRGFLCSRCMGNGKEKREKRMVITIPPGVRSGREERIHLDPAWGIDLLITVRVKR